MVIRLMLLFVPDVSEALWNFVSCVPPNASEAIWHLYCLSLPNTSKAIRLILLCVMPDAPVAIWHVLFVICFRLMPVWLYGMSCFFLPDAYAAIWLVFLSYASMAIWNLCCVSCLMPPTLYGMCCFA